MRTIISILAVAALAVIVGCAHTGEGPSFWQDKTVLQSDRTIPELITLASDSSASEADRTRAVFNLFAQHLRPGCTSAEFRGLLSSTNWLRDCRLDGVYLLGGWIPVDTTPGDTVFSLSLFPSPSDRGSSLWIIYFRLTGKLRENDARAFLAGDPLAGSKTRMVEFALCVPHSTSPGHLPGRIERFSSRGMHVYNEWAANHPAAGKAGTASLLEVGHQWPGLPEPVR